ncbi:hypothetical protein HPB47_022874 [Ixodes persulcatus]|uniref:Uncharacterized protein n=1 Tax=Ixodes persulcatus TaxID=34615 RepID=A0AC60Q8K2_IXOPE|nr:hypothetical protein HPB47_022874 [Ixodes persulcatus]
MWAARSTPPEESAPPPGQSLVLPLVQDAATLTQRPATPRADPCALQRKFTCQICKMVISRKDHLWRHMRRVHGVDQQTAASQLLLTCPFCLKGLPSMAALEEHVDSCHPYANGKD